VHCVALLFILALSPPFYDMTPSFPSVRRPLPFSALPQTRVLTSPCHSSSPSPVLRAENGTVTKTAGCPAAFKALLSYHLSATVVGSLTSANGTKIAVPSIDTTSTHVALIAKKNVTVADAITVKFNLDKTAPVFVDLLGRSVATNSFAEPSTFGNGTQVLYCIGERARGAREVYEGREMPER
jgi:hypothetical protein